jgi:hypothetical protein
MEPRALANINGNLVRYDSPVAKDATPAARTSFSPTKEFLMFDSPASRRNTFTISPPITPQQQQRTTNGDDDDMSLSPTTPYFLRPSEITQRTCPPKPRLLFPGAGEGGGDMVGEDGVVKQRLLLARRKSLQWAPKVSSPLGRGVSFGG